MKPRFVYAGVIAASVPLLAWLATRQSRRRMCASARIAALVTAGWQRSGRPATSRLRRRRSSKSSRKRARQLASCSRLQRGVRVAERAAGVGPWNKIADAGELPSKGSALQRSGGVFYRPSIQAWYQQFLAVDPSDANHVFAGLEEVYKTEDAGAHWTAIGPCWNFDFACWSVFDSQNMCPMTTHPGLRTAKCTSATTAACFARPVRGTVNVNGNATDWQKLNANVRTLQYYSVAVGKVIPDNRLYAVTGFGQSRSRNDAVSYQLSVLAT